LGEEALGATVSGVAQASGGQQTLAEEDTLRASVYTLLGWLLKSPPTASDLHRLGSLKGDASDLGQAISALAAVARAARPEAVDDEFHALFIGVGRGELLPYGSYYMAGFLNEKPLAKLRIDMAQLGIARATGVAETEDHIAALCQTMAGLIMGEFGEPADLPTQQRFFDTHVVPWAGKFFEELEAADSAAFFMPVGTIGKLFMHIEAQAFQMAA
jgi:TorA maturation chaperone TorD